MPLRGRGYAPGCYAPAPRIPGCAVAPPAFCGASYGRVLARARRFGYLSFPLGAYAGACPALPCARPHPPLRSVVVVRSLARRVLRGQLASFTSAIPRAACLPALALSASLSRPAPPNHASATRPLCPAPLGLGGQPQCACGLLWSASRALRLPSGAGLSPARALAPPSRARAPPLRSARPGSPRPTAAVIPCDLRPSHLPFL